MTVVLMATGAMFAFAVFASLVRIVRGPTTLDRVIAADVLTAALVCWLGVWMVANKDTTLIPVLIALALFAVVGSVSTARFMAGKEDS
ncbi:monovalent cation/H+ antiporter complex subunit F [Demequina sp.]|uniref:monovalent cation/H+ antiporter complex subunit F n=1 Tax=Demequina sp. TaxID=2050685 RepID=UPI003A8B089A